MIDQLLDGEMPLLRSEFVRGSGGDSSRGVSILVLLNGDDLLGGDLSSARMLLEVPHQVRLLRRAVSTVATFEGSFAGMGAHVTDDGVAVERIVAADSALVLNLRNVPLELRENQFVVVAGSRELFCSFSEGWIEFRLNFDDFRYDSREFASFAACVHNIRGSEEDVRYGSDH